MLLLFWKNSANFRYQKIEKNRKRKKQKNLVILEPAEIFFVLEGGGEGGGGGCLDECWINQYEWVFG